MAKTASNIGTLGPVTATIDTSTDMGYVQNVAIKVGNPSEDVPCESFASPVGAVRKGATIEAKLLVEEGLNYDNWVNLMGGTEVVGTETVGTATNTVTKVTFGSAAGQPVDTFQLDLVSVDAAKAGTHDIRIYKGFIVGEPVEVPITGKDIVAYEITVRGLIDTSRSDGDMLWAIGDQSATAA